MTRASHVLQRSGLAVLISCLITTAAWAQVAGPAGNIPLLSEELAQRESHGDFEIVSVKGAGGGIMGAKKLRLRFDDGVEINVKWKRAPAGAEGWNNSPRREIAAYEVQKLFLEPDDYVVPVSVPRCIPLDTYAAVERRTQGNVLGATASSVCSRFGCRTSCSPSSCSTPRVSSATAAMREAWAASTF